MNMSIGGDGIFFSDLLTGKGQQRDLDDRFSDLHFFFKSPNTIIYDLIKS